MHRRSIPPPQLTIPPAMALSAAAGVLALALGFYARHARPSILDVPLIDSGARLFFVLTLLAAIGLGWQVHCLYDRRPLGYTPYPPLPTAWILPSMLLIASALLVARYHTAPVIVMAAVVAASGTFASLSIREVVSADGPGDDPLLLVHVGMSLIVAYVVIAALLQYQARLLFTAPTVFIASALILLQVHDGIPTYPLRRQAYALVGAIAAAELAWPLYYWPPAGWWTGAVIGSVLLGYALITRASLLKRLNPAAALQYAGLTVACLRLLS
ncbi:MAG: hypothetical protein M9890_08870 [Thermomicrobiales bacterium]|nr:hypothetical protein [Thermomicrobiales bacterium]